MAVNNSNSNQPITTDELTTEQQPRLSQVFTLGPEGPMEEEEEEVEELEEEAFEEEDEEELRVEAAAEAIRLRKEARLSRQAQTRARLAEISAQMRARDMLRRRWIPARLAAPLQRWFIRSGYVNNPTEALLFLLGVVSLATAIGVGVWWNRT